MCGVFVCLFGLTSVHPKVVLDMHVLVCAFVSLFDLTSVHPKVILNMYGLVDFRML